MLGKSKKQPLKARIRNARYQSKRKKAEAAIMVNPHSLSETVEYAKDKYGLTETACTVDCHLYEIRIDDDCLEVEVDYNRNILAISYSCSKALMKRFKEISRDLYSYYSVSEDDIKNKTERYSALVTELSS
ncbi:MAG: hypothetical protein Q4E78_04835 [Eubacteriales bacterium]|nr:hypothetical protein [Eubacteriales bacterium]